MSKENVLEVLAYIYNNYMSTHNRIIDGAQHVTTSELEEAGFSREEITKTLIWLDGLVDLQHINEHGSSPISEKSFRVFSDHECKKLNADVRGYIFFLEYIEILNPVTRELVIDRAMALDKFVLDVDQIDWVVLLILFNYPGSEEAFAWMEDYVFGDNVGTTH